MTKDKVQLQRLVWATVGPALISMLLAVAQPVRAHAQVGDSQTNLALAQADEATAQQTITTATASKQTAEKELAASTSRADSLNAAAAAANSELQNVKNGLIQQRTAASAEVKNRTDDYQQSKDSYETDRSAGYGFAIAALLLALVAVFWGWFRRNPLADYLAKRGLGPAIGVLVGMLLVILILGGATVTIGGLAANVIGATIVFVGIGLPIALILARHSLRRERGLGKSMIWRERAPRWVSIGSAVLLLGLLAIGLGGALSTDKPVRPVFSAETLQLASDAGGDPADPPSPALAQAQAAYAAALGPAQTATAARDQARTALSQAERQLARANRQLARAQRDITHYTARIAAEQAAAAEAAVAAEAAAAEAAPPAYSPPASGTTEDFGSGNGYVVTCSDGTLSDSGGIQGACSSHGGVAP